VHVPKVMQHERQHHFHVEAAALMATFRLCSLHYGKLTLNCHLIPKRVPELSQEVVDVPVEQHVEQVVHVPVALGLVFQFPACACRLGQGTPGSPGSCTCLSRNEI
jgi:hypothetical protein